MSLRAVRVPLQSELAPFEAVLALRGDRRPFALVGAWAGGGMVLGSEPVRTLARGADPFAVLDDLPAVAAGDAAIGGGWFGVLGYELGRLVERLAPSPPAPLPRPPHALAYYDHVVRHDGERWWFEALRENHPRLALWEARLAARHQPRPFSAGSFAAAGAAAAGHRAAVAACVERIAAGELFQANLALRLEAPFDGDPLDVFAAAADAVRPRFGAYFDGVVSLSPERFLRRAGRCVESEPIKGTAPDPAALATSAKDAAEHVMIVDLMRNDLGRVCAYGSIAAGAPRVEAYAGVHHLVSTVSGELRPGASDADLLRATFPPGSVTGAPKVQAMKVIAELEGTRREAYTGAMGYASPIAGLELNVAIRTLEFAAGRVWLGAGGGVVADSTPDGELAEALAKASGPLSSVEWTVDVAGRHQLSTRREGGRWRRWRRALELGPRPDPALGLLETIRLQDGIAYDLDAHLARLARSAAALYDIALPEDLRARIAAVVGDGRVRLVLTPDGHVTLEALPVPARSAPRRLVPYVLPGGAGAHKWADRRLLAALDRDAGADADALVVDAEGAVLEAGWGSVFLREGERWVTPPADGRLLPGVHRARRLAAGATEEPCDLDRLAAADEILLTSALRAVSLARPNVHLTPL